MKRFRNAALHLALPLALSACGEGDASTGGWAGTVDTLANGAVLVHSPASGVWDSASAWRLEEDWRIGTATGSGPELFGQIRDLAVDRLGRLYVLDNQAKEIRVFGPDGAYVRSIGRQGSGPGELENPNGMEWDPNGRLWVADPGNARYTVFDTTGVFVEDYIRPIGSWGYLWDGAFDDAGYLYESDSRLVGPGEREGIIVRMDSTAVVLDTFPEPDYEILAYRLSSPDGRNMMATIPFTPIMRWLVDGDGTLWFGAGDTYRIHRRSLEGDSLRIVERDYEPVLVTAAERDEALDNEFLDEMRRRGGDVDPDLVPEHKPAYQGLALDPEDHLWVRTPSPDPGETLFDVFDPDGRYLGQVRSGIEMEEYPPPLIAGNAVYAVVEDELEVPYVVRLRVVGREGDGEPR